MIYVLPYSNVYICNICNFLWLKIYVYTGNIRCIVKQHVNDYFPSVGYIYMIVFIKITESVQCNP